MNKTLILANAIGFIDDDLILESEQSAARKPLRLGYAAAAAACLCVAGGAAVVVNNRSVPEADGQTISLAVPISAVSPAQPAENSAPEPAVSVPALTADGIIFNEVTEEIGGERLYFDPEIYDEIKWDKSDILEYYGRELTPAYIPEGLTPSAWNEQGMTVFVEKGGEIVYDRVGLSFYHDYYEDGSPKLTEDIAATKGFGLAVSRLGYPFECGIFSDLDGKSTTDIKGTPVAFSHRSAPYGPYDPETHEPSGYYDIYIAEFETDGIYFRVVTDQLPADEIIQIVASILA